MINDYNEVRECAYKDEVYSVRDNGAIMRHLREGKKPRIDDGIWTFGKKNETNGYMYLGSHRVHIIVATAFLGERDSKVYVVDHIDTNRCNNRIENLHWFTRLENAIKNPITRNKIIYLCGSIEAFIENPNILRERLRHAKEPSLEWMRTVTREEAKIAYENVKKFWEEMAKNPRPLSGGQMNDSVYRKQSNEKKDTPTQTKKEVSNSEAQHIVTDENWEQMTRSLWNPMPQQPKEQELEVEESYIMSLTPNAAQHPYLLDEKPCYYPSTPQEISNNPLQSYYDALEPGKVFWKKHNGKVTYIVDKRDWAEDGNSLIIMSKDNFSEEIIEIQKSLPKDEYKKIEAQHQINEITYKNGLFIHHRISTGFLPKFYLNDWYNELIGKKKKRKKGNDTNNA